MRNLLVVGIFVIFSRKTRHPAEIFALHDTRFERYVTVHGSHCFSWKNVGDALAYCCLHTSFTNASLIRNARDFIPTPKCASYVCIPASRAQVLKPDLVINAGTAGGFKKHDTAIGDVFISTRVRNHDRR